MQDIKAAARAINPQVVEWRRELHANPEVGHELPFAESVVVRELSRLDLDEIRPGQGRGHGVFATLRGGKPGKTLALRADMDALPMREETGLPFAATNGNMHACGHDAHVAMLLAAAEILSARRAELSGTVRFIFQPAEEAVGGAVSVIESGALDNPQVDAIVGLHTGHIWEGLTAGQIGWKIGPMMASTTTLKIAIEGSGGHGATPHLTVDPIVVAAAVVTELQTVLSRELNPFDPAVVTIGKIAGGTAHNIIADRCEMSGTMRNFDNKVDAFMKKRIAEIVEGIATTMRGRATVEFLSHIPPVVNDPAIALKMRDVVEAELGEGWAKEVLLPSSGAEDFACFLEKVPGAFFYHCSAFGDERDYPHHNARFDVNEDVLWTGVAAMAAFALNWQR